MRVLHIANFSWFSFSRKRADNVARYYATDRKISNGLVRNGCCVQEFSYRDTARHFAPLSFGKKLGAKKMNENLLSVAAAFAPNSRRLAHATSKSQNRSMVGRSICTAFAFALT